MRNIRSRADGPLSASRPPEAQGLLDDLPKPSGVRPPPKDPSAGQTGEEGVVVELGFGREPVEDLHFRDGGEPSVAGQAAREGGGGAGEVEPPDDLRELLARVRPVDGGGVGQLPPLEEPAVARKEDPPLAERQRNELLVGGVALPDRVEAEQAEPARQLPEVDVKDEARLTQRSRAEVHDRGDIQSLEDRVDADAVSYKH